ncbi:pachytene checkpoint protein 2 homolog [Condylostylus longicornis]|uniref:pachytene checkpoint protein 2 homolog n=1 Tax=Condylostylus longicornis TaxID=2530218 RepID=UPI00244E041C|nr:pachytene checkpoint protein 2 homolog [Condylostylus longicornis]
MHQKIDVEVSLSSPKSSYNLNMLKQQLLEILSNCEPAEFEKDLANNYKKNPDLEGSIQSITLPENLNGKPDDIESYNFYFYHLYSRSCEDEMIDNLDDEDETCASNHWILPNKEFEGLYESLVYDNHIKDEILRFAQSAIIFGNYNVNKNLISCNRLILLHGPPGTGKTSLCKAIAHKLSIRLNSIYKFTHFIEINSHSLFSKWFSESGKLVAKLFAKIREMISQPNSLVCVLIDEVESIAYDRGSLSGEPKDALRVVNAVLTQLDQLKHYSNVMVFATSNLMDTIDIAFIDRVDLKKLITFPSAKAIFNIYISAIKDLSRVGLINVLDNNIKTFDDLQLINKADNTKTDDLLKEIVDASVGLSGRVLRKIPFLAHTSIHHSPTQINKVNLDCFLSCMLKVIHERKSAN